MRLKVLIIIFIFKSILELNAQIIKKDIKLFLNNYITKENYNINNFEKSISNNSYDHSLLLNKAVRFKMFLDAQKYSSDTYSINCNNISSQIGLTNIKITNFLSQGIKNANFLFKTALKKNPSFESEFSEILNEQTKLLKPYFKYSISDCNSVLEQLQMRLKGVFLDEKLGKNILSFNYLLNPVNEILEGHKQEFSSLNYSSEEDFFFILDLPKSWNFKNKKEFSNLSTVGYFKSNEDFLNANISVSILPDRIMSEAKMLANKITDSKIVDFIYEDEEILTNIIKRFDSKVVKNKLYYTLLNYGDKKIILYKSRYDLGKEFKNEILNDHNLEFLTAIYVKNGKIIIVNCGAMSKKNDFNSYNYYSKVFYKVITSIKFKNIKKNILYLTEVQGMKFVEVNIDNLSYNFLLDTGATSIVINKKILSELMKNGIITKNNYLGKDKAEIANGTVIICENWLIPEIIIGNKKIKNIEVSVVDSENSIPLFGMEGLNRLNVLKLNLRKNEILLNSE